MRSNCTAEKGRLQFLFFFRQRCRKIVFRQDPRSELACDENDDLVGTNASGRELSEYETENKRSRLGWGTTHI